MNKSFASVKSSGRDDFDPYETQIKFNIPDAVNP